MAFSGGVKLGDLDDFIAASQECTATLITAASGKTGPAKIGSTGGLGGAALGARAAAAAEVPEVQRPNLIKTKKSKEDPKASIAGVTLSDCLACSGCVTSAETVLLQAQSGEEFLRRVQEAPLTVVTVSAETRTSIAAHCGASPLLTLQRLAAALSELGAAYVLENSAAEAIALLEAKAEFTQRYRDVQRRKGSNPEDKGKVARSAGSNVVIARKDAVQSLPLLTSHCPGWTCYAEKVVDPAVLPHMATLRPPGQVQGRLVKTCLLEAHNRRRLHRWWRARTPLFAGQCGWWLQGLMARGHAAVSAGPAPLSPADVYHVSVQPCFDRKLEAARPGFELPGGEVREVDTVLSTTELLELLAKRSDVAQEGDTDAKAVAAVAAEALEAAAPCRLDGEVLTDLLLGSLSDPGRPQPLLCNVHGNAGAGGFLEHVFRESVRELFGAESASPVELVAKQNEDMREVVYKDPSSGKELLRFVAAYGFRNIQNVIKKATRAGAELGGECGHFVEIMACPGGCLNGGGQLPAPKSQGSRGQQDRRAHLEKLEGTLLHGDGTASVNPAQHPLVPGLYAYIVGAAAGSKKPGPGKAGEGQELKNLVGSAPVRSWLLAEWRSLKVDAEGNDVLGSSALKW